MKIQVVSHDYMDMPLITKLHLKQDFICIYP